MKLPGMIQKKIGDEIEAVILSGGANLGCEVLENVLRVEQDATVGSENGASEVVVPGAKTQKIKGTTTLALDFDEFDDEVHDEEAEHFSSFRVYYQCEYW
jgi:hypothetical protein